MMLLLGCELLHYAAKRSSWQKLKKKNKIIKKSKFLPAPSSEKWKKPWAQFPCAHSHLSGKGRGPECRMARAGGTAVASWGQGCGEHQPWVGLSSAPCPDDSSSLLDLCFRSNFQGIRKNKPESGRLPKWITAFVI